MLLWFLPSTAFLIDKVNVSVKTTTYDPLLESDSRAILEGILNEFRNGKRVVRIEELSVEIRLSSFFEGLREKTNYVVKITSKNPDLSMIFITLKRGGVKNRLVLKKVLKSCVKKFLKRLKKVKTKK